MKKTVIVLCVTGIVCIWAYYFYQNITTLSSVPIPISPSPIPTQIIIPTPTITDLELIKIAFANELGKPVDQVIIKLSENNSSHARCSINFANENGGGWCLAAKTKGEWVAVADGNGYVSCDAILPYKFPKSMIPECVDSKGKLLIL